MCCNRHIYFLPVSLIQYKKLISFIILFNGFRISEAAVTFFTVPILMPEKRKGGGEGCVTERKLIWFIGH